MIHPKKKQILSGWGNLSKINSWIYRPEKEKELNSILNNDNSFIARGMGRSYGDAALNSHSIVLSERLDRFLSFDKKSGVITVQSGVTLSEILDVVIPRGWLLPVIPGTKQVSIGGALASNIHGKNHYRTGDFANHVVNCKLLLANGDALDCSANKNADIFWATAGGMGMTGIIKEVSLQLKPIKSLSLNSQTKKVNNILKMVEEFQSAKDTHEYMIGWIDHFAKGKNLGRGVFEKAYHISVEEGGKDLSSYTPPEGGITIPKFFPSFVLNKYSMAFYNILRFSKFSYNWKEEVVNFEGFFHPLDNLKNWNNLYGKTGFFQYQFIIPDNKDVADNLNKILSKIQGRGEFSFLAVLKYHGDHKGLLSFPLKGFSLALDLPNTKNVRKLQNELNEIVCDLGGRTYLAKDALLSAKIFEKMYKEHLPKWRKIIFEIDANGKFESLMSKRLNFRGDKND